MNPFGDAAGFLIAGYGLTWAALLIYTWRIERRLEEARRDLDGGKEE